MFRYLSTDPNLDKVASFFSTQRVWLTKISDFPDHREGASTPATEEFYRKFEEHHFGMFNAERRRQMIEESRICTFANCWHANEDESEEMWAEYCPEGTGVAIKTTFTQLREQCDKQGGNKFNIGGRTTARTIIFRPETPSTHS